MTLRLSHGPAILLFATVSLCVFGHPAQATTCAPQPPGLVGWWRLNGDATDATGNHDGVATGGSFPAAEVGLGYAPGGQGNLITIPDDPALSPPHFTIDCWVFMEELTDVNAGLVWKGNDGGADPTSSYGLAIYGVNGGPVPLIGLPFMTVGNGAQSQELDSSVLAPIGEFFHLAATADGTTLNLYLNGQLVGTAPQVVASGPTGWPVRLAGLTAFNPGPTILDEVELHNAAATPEQILAIYEAGAAGKCPDIPVPVEPSSWSHIKARVMD